MRVQEKYFKANTKLEFSLCYEMYVNVYLIITPIQLMHNILYADYSMNRIKLSLTELFEWGIAPFFPYHSYF